jgi:hypothetical protein
MAETTSLALWSQLKAAVLRVNQLEGAVHSLALRTRFQEKINLRMETRLLVMSMQLLSARRKKRLLTQKLLAVSRRLPIH